MIDSKYIIPDRLTHQAQYVIDMYNKTIIRKDVGLYGETIARFYYSNNSGHIYEDCTWDGKRIYNIRDNVIFECDEFLLNGYARYYFKNGVIYKTDITGVPQGQIATYEIINQECSSKPVDNISTDTNTVNNQSEYTKYPLSDFELYLCLFSPLILIVLIWLISEIVQDPPVFSFIKNVFVNTFYIPILLGTGYLVLQIPIFPLAKYFRISIKNFKEIKKEKKVLNIIAHIGLLCDQYLWGTIVWLCIGYFLLDMTAPDGTTHIMIGLIGMLLGYAILKFFEETATSPLMDTDDYSDFDISECNLEDYHYDYVELYDESSMIKKNSVNINEPEDYLTEDNSYSSGTSFKYTPMTDDEIKESQMKINSK